MSSGISERTLVKCGAVVCKGCAVWLCALSICCAQAEQAHRRHRSNPDAGVATSTAHPASTHSATAIKHPAATTGQKPANEPSALEAVTRPATVDLRSGKLTVVANNSDLTQILQDLAGLSGMTITGLTKGPRVFGVYGPGNSRKILTDLLFGSGYNFMMVGGAMDGTPRELLLTSRDTNVQTLTQRNSRLAPHGDSDETEPPEVELDPPGPSAIDPSLPTALGPGAIAPIPSQDSEDENIRIQRNLQRLQQMQDQQQKNAPQ